MTRTICVGLAAALFAGFAGTVSPLTAQAFELRQNAEPKGVPLAYFRLLDTLDATRGAKPGRSADARIFAAVRGLQAAIKLDGGARNDLLTTAENIANSLSDGTFDASRSIDAIKRGSTVDAIEAGLWLPEAMPGSWIEGPIGRIMHQGGIGDCVGISIVKAFSTTPVGSAILSRSVKKGADGGFNVLLPGNPSRISVAAGDVTQFGAGDSAAGAIIGALFKSFRIDPKRGALPTNKAMALLSSGFGSHARFWDAEANPAQIQAYLLRNAAHVGKDTAMVFGGASGKDAAWSRGDGHAFAVLRIDAGAGTLIYTNPWDETRERTIPIAVLAQEAAGTGADFETVVFDPRVLMASIDPKAAELDAGERVEARTAYR